MTRHASMRTDRLFSWVWLLLAMLTVTPILRADPLVVSQESPAFVLDARLSTGSTQFNNLVVTIASPVFALDTRLASDASNQGALVVVTPSPGFVLDTRLAAGNGIVSNLVITADSAGFTLDTRVSGTAITGFTVTGEAPGFTLDTRLASVTNAGGLVIIAESTAFTLDTRLSAATTSSGLVVIAESSGFTLDTRLSSATNTAALVVAAASATFVLDTRLSTANPVFAGLVVQAGSSGFTLDTRLTPPDPRWASLVVEAGSGGFTLDTRNPPPFTTLARFDNASGAGRLRFSPDGMLLAAADGSRVVMRNLHSTRAGAAITGHNSTVASVEFSPLGDQLLTGSWDGTARWWDTATRLPQGNINPGFGAPLFAAWSADGARILAGAGTNLRLYSFPVGQELRAFPGLADSITALALSPDGTKAVVGTSVRVVVVWNTANGQVLWRGSNHNHLITAAAFTPDNARVLTAALDETVRLWDATTGAEVARLTHRAPVQDAMLSADGQLVASCDTANPGRAYLWDAASGALIQVFSDTGGESGQILGVAVSPDQTMIATAHTDGQVRLWDTGRSPRPRQTLTPLAVGGSVPVTLASHGLYYFEVNAQPNQSLVFTLETAGVGPQSLGAGQAASKSGLSADVGFANLKTDGREAGRAIAPQSLSLPPVNTDVTAFRMTAMRGRVPSVYDYETFAQAPVTNLHCELPVATGASNKVYVLVFAPYLSAGSISARISAVAADFHLSSITPARGGNAGAVTAEVRGTGFNSATTARPCPHRLRSRR